MSRKQSTPIKPELFRVREFARRYGMSDSQVRNYIRDGTVKAVRLPGIRAVRIPQESADAFAAALAPLAVRADPEKDSA